MSFYVHTEAKFTTFWNVILDEKKQLLTTEKFLSQASEESKETVSDFTLQQKLLLLKQNYTANLCLRLV